MMSYSAIKGAAIWNYIGRLVELLCSSTLDKAYRAIVLQEISNTCHLEYRRAQAIFKRHVQTASGSKWFKRVSNVYDDVGNARVTMRGDPAEPRHPTIRVVIDIRGIQKIERLPLQTGYYQGGSQSQAYILEDDNILCSAWVHAKVVLLYACQMKH
jgi:hypothetical protein